MTADDLKHFYIVTDSGYPSLEYFADPNPANGAMTRKPKTATPIATTVAARLRWTGSGSPCEFRVIFSGARKAPV